MNRVKPVTPEDLKEKLGENIPSSVIEAFNQLLSENYRGKGSITIKVKDVLNRIMKLDESLTKAEIFDKHYLDIEQLYKNNGWIVNYESPDRDETFEEYFEFKPNK